MNAKMNKFIDELRTLLGNKYTVRFNTDADTWQGARILIDSDFNCNVYEGRDTGYIRCRSCHCKYNCNISQEFEDLVAKHNFRYAFIIGQTIGLWRN